jgi:hypothetical protein
MLLISDEAEWRICSLTTCTDRATVIPHPFLSTVGFQQACSRTAPEGVPGASLPALDAF